MPARALNSAGSFYGLSEGTAIMFHPRNSLNQVCCSGRCVKPDNSKLRPGIKQKIQKAGTG